MLDKMDLFRTSMVNEKYDNISLNYTGTKVTSVDYKIGSIKVATITLTYLGDNLQSVVKT